MALIRGHLRQRGLQQAKAVNDCADGVRVLTAGLVITRQRPSSANSITFVTLEDETGQMNLVVWKRLVERQRGVLLGARLLGARLLGARLLGARLLGARLLGVVGEVQREGSVVHLVARRLMDYSALLGGLSVRSRDFH